MSHFARRIVAAVFLVGLVVSADLPTVQADGLILQLPKDGTSAEYDLKIQFSDDADRKADGSLKIASVGSETVKDEKCRWIEVTLTIKISGESRSQIFKMLIPEKQLKRGGEPLKHVVRAWQKETDGEPQPLKNPASNDRPLAGILSGPLEKTRKLPSVETESKLGKLNCAGLSGSKTLEEPGAKRTVELTVTSRTHAKAPFGVVTSSMTYAITRNGRQSEKGKIDFKLSEVGDKAVSAIPDKK